MLRNKRGRKWKLVIKLLQTTELFLLIAPCTLIPCNKYVSENISDLQAHKQLKCLNVPYLANKIAWNITHFLFSSLVHVLLIVPALTYLKEMADNTCDGQAGGGRQCII
jgi:hypothetical protein